MATQQTPHTVTAGSFSQPFQRLLSLDVLRGITVALMILVNNAGSGKDSFSQLKHSAWNGCTLTDLVFPTFLFIVGASVTLSLRRRIALNIRRGSILLQVLKRALVIFAIGLFINALPYFQLSTLRYYGVLQRIAICYALASIVYLYGGIVASAIIAAACVVGYWFLLVHVRVPGFGMPGVDLPILNPEGNLAGWLDRLLVPAAHLYHRTVYDPEGLLSTICALATTLIGVVAGWVLQGTRPQRAKAANLFVCAILLIATGLTWSHWLPLNKRLWTSSFALFTAGVAMLSLAILFHYIDGTSKLLRGLKPALIFGSNALTAYVFSEVLAIVLGAITLSHGQTLQQAIYRFMPAFGSPSLMSLTYSVLFVLVCYVPVAYLYRHKIFLKL